jgi:hypothetical protein
MPELPVENSGESTGASLCSRGGQGMDQSQERHQYR